MTLAEMIQTEAKRTATDLPKLRLGGALVDLHLRKYQVTKTDKQATRKVADDHGSDVTRARVIKHLLDPSRMEPINQLDGEIRAYHYEHTTGWGEGTARLLSAKLLDEYVAYMADAKRKRQALVDAFVDGYEQFVREDAIGLGMLARRNDYVKPESIATKFGMSFELRDVPDSGHFEVLGIDQHIDAIRDQIEETNREAAAGVQRELAGRIREVVEHLAERIGVLNGVDPVTGKTAEGKIVRFHDSAIENVAALAELLPRLNVIEDPMIEDLAGRMRDKLCAWDKDALKTSPDARKEVETEATAILTALDNFIPSFE